jgi:hypothetical protein
MKYVARARFLPLVIGIAIAVACGGSPVATTETGASIEYVFADGISTGDRKIVKQAIEASRAFYRRELGRDLQLDITIEVRDEDGHGYTGVSYGRKAWIFTGSAGWFEGSGEIATYQKASLVAHELFHNFQSDLMYTDDAIPSHSVWWIVEGSAEYASARFLAYEYGYDWSDLVDGYDWIATESLPRLDSNALKSWGLYAKAFLAVNELMQERPLRVLADYFEMTGYTDWKEAFVTTFGVDPISFLEQFEADFR